MIKVNSKEKLDNFIQTDEYCFVNFNQKQIEMNDEYISHNISEDSDSDSEMYSVYQKYFDYTPTLRERKLAIIEGIKMYDKSDSVNTFIYNGQHYWLDRETRVSVMNTVNILKASGETTATLWVGKLELVLPCDTIIYILTALEKYALQCYNVTQRHINAVNEMSLTDAYEYDFEVGYPTPLEFNI